MRENGISGGQGAYGFATSLANRYSEKLDNRSFCQTVENFSRLAARASHRELLRLADSVAEAPESGSCPASSYRFDRDDEEANLPDYARRQEPPAPPRISIVEKAPDPAPAPIAVAQAVPAPAAEGKEAVIQKGVAEAAPPPAPAPTPAAAPVAAPAQPAREEALLAAILVLKSAVTALQAVSAPAPAAAAEPMLVKVADAPVVPPEEPKQK